MLLLQNTCLQEPGQDNQANSETYSLMRLMKCLPHCIFLESFIFVLLYNFLVRVQVDLNTLRLDYEHANSLLLAIYLPPALKMRTGNTYVHMWYKTVC